MLKMFTVFLVLCALASTLDASFIDYRLVSIPNKASRAVGDVTCTVPGPICDPDCKTIWSCIYNNNAWKKVALGNCNQTQTCNNGVCSNTPTPECSLAKTNFKCQNEGVFPDPSTCKQYHYCIFDDPTAEPPTWLGITPRTCNTNRGYNARTTYCDKPLANNQCGANYPVPMCTRPGQPGPVKDNPSMYFVCSLYDDIIGNILYPYLYLCPDGRTYDGAYGCRP